MKSAGSLRHAVLLSLALGALQGCQWGDRHANAQELSRLHGLSTLEFDGVCLRLKRDSSDASGLVLIVAGQAVEEATLRLGDRFVLTDGRGVYETYQVLLVDPERVMLKRQRTFDRRASREGIRSVEDVVTVTPYNLEETG
jgi:hypothetical protein